MAFSRSLMGNKKKIIIKRLGLILFSFLHQSCSHYKITVIWFCNSVLYWSCNRNTVELKQFSETEQENYVISKFRPKKTPKLRQPGISKFAEQCKDYKDWTHRRKCVHKVIGRNRVWELTVMVPALLSPLKGLRWNLSKAFLMSFIKVCEDLESYPAFSSGISEKLLEAAVDNGDIRYHARLHYNWSERCLGAEQPTLPCRTVSRGCLVQ